MQKWLRTKKKIQVKVNKMINCLLFMIPLAFFYLERVASRRVCRLIFYTFIHKNFWTTSDTLFEKLCLNFSCFWLLKKLSLNMYVLFFILLVQSLWKEKRSVNISVLNVLFRKIGTQTFFLSRQIFCDLVAL